MNNKELEDFGNEIEKNPIGRRKRSITPIDPICLIHEKKASEHNCLYCCLCFKSLTFEECHILPNGKREDVCNECAEKEMNVQKKNCNCILSGGGVQPEHCRIHGL